MKIKPVFVYKATFFAFLAFRLSWKTIQMAEATTPPEFTILYHFPGKFKGRGEFLRLMLEDAGKPYVHGDNLYGPTGMMDMFRGSVEAIVNDEADQKQTFPLMYPPAIWHRQPNGEEVLVNQVGACMMYLGEILGYHPPSPAERARATSVMLNCLDYISEARSSFHPVKNSMSYNDQKEEGDRVSKEFTKDRMKRFLLHFNKVVLKHGSKKPVAGGEKITYADFALFYVIDATIHQFNTEYYEMAWDNMDVPALKEYHEWFGARPNLVQYFKSDRCAPFAGDSMM